MIRSERSIADYDEVFNPVRERRQEYSGRQAGDPAKAAQALLQLVDASNAPTHLLLGNDARRLVEAHLSELNRELANWASVTSSTDFE